MATMQFVYGPVPSRRLGLSLGISPILKKTCNYSCVYCQLGQTHRMTNSRQAFFTSDEIVGELKNFLMQPIEFDVITIVGEGEPTLYLDLGQLIEDIKALTSKPVAVITNGASLYEPLVQEALMYADIVLPSLDAYDAHSFKKINRPHGHLEYSKVLEGLRSFSKKYRGQLWIEIMLISGMNDDDESIESFQAILKTISYDKLYLNTPIRPTAELNIEIVDHKRMAIITKQLQAISIDLLESEGFFSQIEDDLQAIISIIKRHPMNQFEIMSFLNSRACKDYKTILQKLDSDQRVVLLNYKGYITY